MQIGNCNIENINERDAISSFGIDSVRVFARVLLSYRHIASEPIFWHAFKELSKNNNGLVSYYKLQEGLISTGKFYAGEAVLMIEHMEKTGKIEKTGDYNVYRIGKTVSTK